MSTALPNADVDGAPEAENDGEGPDGTANEVTMSDEALYAIEVKEQDRWLPIANVARIMKTALPENAKIAKEAKESMQECVSEFISFITSEASEKCLQEKRKTVNGEDILFAMTSLGFENYSEALKIYLARYRTSNTSKGEGSSKATADKDAVLTNVTEEATAGAQQDADVAVTKVEEDTATAPGEDGSQEPPSAFIGIPSDSNNFAASPYPNANGDENGYNNSYTE